MKALSIHAPYIYEIIRGTKKEEYRTWTPKSLGEDEELLLCSSAKKYPDHVSGYALAVCRIGCVTDYGDAYGWQIKDVRPVKPVPVKGKLHFFEVEDDKIERLPEMSLEKWERLYYDPLAYVPRRRAK